MQLLKNFKKIFELKRIKIFYSNFVGGVKKLLCVSESKRRDLAKIKDRDKSGMREIIIYMRIVMASFSP